LSKCCQSSTKRPRPPPIRQARRGQGSLMSTQFNSSMSILMGRSDGPAVAAHSGRLSQRLRRKGSRYFLTANIQNGCRRAAPRMNGAPKYLINGEPNGGWWCILSRTHHRKGDPMHTFHTFIQQGGVFTISHDVRHGPGKAESWRPPFDVPTRGDTVAAVNMLNGGPRQALRSCGSTSC
jgi:hypothetical protein